MTDNKKVSISVVIPHYNGEQILSDCLLSLYASTELPLEVIVVDNASSDNSVQMLKSEYPSVKIITLSQNRGFAGGCNAGIKEARAPYVLILNNDTVHSKGWLEHLLAKIESEDGIAVVQPKLISYQTPELFDYSGAAGGEMDIFCFPFARGRIFDAIERDEGQYDKLNHFIFWASGTAFLAKRELLIKAGLFDEDFFAHMEEIDLQWRLQLLGYKVVIETKAVIKHISGYTLAAESPLKKYLNHRNSVLMLLTNYQLFLSCYLLPMRIVLDKIAFFYAFFIADWGRCLAIIKAYFWCIFHIGKIVRKRRRVKKIRILSN